MGTVGGERAQKHLFSWLLFQKSKIVNLALRVSSHLQVAQSMHNIVCVRLSVRITLLGKAQLLLSVFQGGKHKVLETRVYCDYLPLKIAGCASSSGWWKVCYFPVNQ